MFKNRDYGDNNVTLAENYKEMARKKKKIDTLCNKYNPHHLWNKHWGNVLADTLDICTRAKVERKMICNNRKSPDHTFASFYKQNWLIHTQF